jgi:hypothetical protein
MGQMGYGRVACGCFFDGGQLVACERHRSIFVLKCDGLDLGYISDIGTDDDAYRTSGLRLAVRFRLRDHAVRALGLLLSRYPSLYGRTKIIRLRPRNVPRAPAP